MSPEEAFKQSSESITGPITKGISKGGILKLYEGLDKAGQDEFKARDTQTPGVRTGRAGSFGVISFGSVLRLTIYLSVSSHSSEELFTAGGDVDWI